MSKITLQDLASLTNEQSAITLINQNSAAIETASDTFLSRDGTSPNAMSADLDMNSNSILNLPAATTDTEPVRKAEFDEAIENLDSGSGFAEDAEESATEAAASALAAAASETAAGLSATSASSSASSASTSASTASTAATSAAASATVAVGNKFNYESSTSMSAPATGSVRFNNATVSSATAIAFSASSAASGNPDISDFIATWDDSTNTTIKGNLLIRKIGTPATWASFNVTGVTDNTTWLQVAVSGGMGSGTWSAADEVSFQFSRAGDKGADGAGAGDVVGPGSATDNAIVRFDGTTGALVQDSAVTVDDATGRITGAIFPNTGLKVQDTNASHTLAITPGSDLSANRTLTVTTGDADRTLTLGGNVTLNGGTVTSGTHSGTNTGDQTITLTSDVTGTGTGSFATTIANDAVTNAKAANMAESRIKGRSAGSGTGDPEDLTGSQVNTILAQKSSFQFVIDGGGSAITTGIKGDLEVPFACTINSARAFADQSGSIVVDIWKDTYANYPPTDADSITASAPVTITTATKSEDTTLTGWTTSLAAGNTLRFNVDSASTVTRVTVSLVVTRT